MQIKSDVEILVCEDRQARKTETNKYMWRKTYSHFKTYRPVMAKKRLATQIIDNARKHTSLLP